MTYHRGPREGCSFSGLSQRLPPDHTAGRALIIALRIAMMRVRNKFQSNIFRSPPYQFWSVSMVDTVDHHAGFAINTAMSEKKFSLIEKFKKGRVKAGGCRY
jgi:hypothetical protein